MTYALAALLALGLFLACYPRARKPLWWLPPAKGLPAFMYHHVGLANPTDEQYPFTVTAQQFETHLQILKDLGMTPVSLAELNGPAVRPALLTFDDGHQDNYTVLFPLLKKHSVKAVIFLVTDKIGTPGYLTWDQAREMKASGLVSFGSHSATHRRLRSLPEEEIRQELLSSRKKIEQELGETPQAFCYPFGAGAFDKRVRPLVLAAGYKYDFSTKKGVNPWPLNPRKPLLRAFPRGGETAEDFRLQATRGRSRF